MGWETDTSHDHDDRYAIEGHSHWNSDVHDSAGADHSHGELERVLAGHRTELNDLQDQIAERDVKIADLYMQVSQTNGILARLATQFEALVNLTEKLALNAKFHSDHHKELT